jgi:hypothetical protein
MERGKFPPPSSSQQPPPEPEPEAPPSEPSRERGAFTPPASTAPDVEHERGLVGPPTTSGPGESSEPTERGEFPPATATPPDPEAERGVMVATQDEAVAPPPSAPQSRGVIAPTLLSGSGPALPSSLTVAGLRQRLDKKSTAEDLYLQELLEAAFAQMQGPPPYGCGRLLTATASGTVKTFRLRWRRVLVPDATEIAGVMVGSESISEYHTQEADGYVIAIELPDSVVKAGWTPLWGWDAFPLPPGYVQGDRVVSVTARFGFTSIPPNLNEAIYLLAARMYYERQAEYADQVAVGEGATAQIYYRQLPPRVKLAIESFSIPSGYGGLA